MTPARPLQAVGSGALAVTPHHAATEAVLEVMTAGGNAVDGAIAANAVQGVVAPETCGIGGDLFALIHLPGSPSPLALNASGRAGSGASAERLRDAGASGVPLRGAESVTVPGCIDGWEALNERLGTMPLRDVLAPAVRTAGGFKASPELSDALARYGAELTAVPAAATLYPDGVPAASGDEIARPELAATLEAIAVDGRNAFYSGEAGAGITAATDGQVTADDLARRQADWIDPLPGRVWGRTGWTIPPNSQGWVTLAAGWLLEQLAPAPNPDDPAWTHAQVEAYRAVAWEIDSTVADPDHLAAPPEELVDPVRLAARLASLRPDATAAWPAARPVPGGTAYLCVIDGAGMGVSLIQSNFHGIGCLRGAGESGVLLHNRGAGFCLEPGHPNELAPGKRPRHTLSPTLWTRDGRLELLLGTRGGHQQPQYLLQFAAAHFALGDPAPTAQTRPRWAMTEFGGGAASRVLLESRASEPVVDGLRKRGHVVVTADPWMGSWGPISAIAVAGDGTRTGAADPRVSTATALVP